LQNFIYKIFLKDVNAKFLTKKL